MARSPAGPRRRLTSPCRCHCAQSTRHLGTYRFTLFLAGRPPKDFEPRGTFEQVLGRTIFIGIDRELAWLVVTTRLDPRRLPVDLDLTVLLDEPVLDRPLAGSGRQIGAS